MSSFETAFRRLFETEFQSLFRYLDRVSGDPALAADLAQESFVRLFARGEMPRESRGWLVTVAGNLLRDEWRRSSRRRRLLEEAAGDAWATEAAPAPDEDILRQERRALVRSALERLPERDRRALLLRQEGFTYREIAAALGMAESGMGTVLARAKASFLSAFEVVRRGSALD